MFYDKQMEKLKLYSNNKIISNINYQNIIKSQLNSKIESVNVKKYDQDKVYWNYYKTLNIFDNCSVIKYIL